MEANDTRRGRFSADVLKGIAVVSMLCDHACYVFVTTSMHPLRWIGRLAFPIFAFLIAEGAAKTKHPARYLLRLAAFALLSELPFDLALFGTPFYPEYQNVFFTLFFGLFAVCALRLLEPRGGAWPLLSALPLAAAMAGAYCLNADYRAEGVLCIFAFYLAKKQEDRRGVYGFALSLAALAPCLYYSEVRGALLFNAAETANLLAVPLLMQYNGRRGKKVNKYLFYAIYPAHLLLLALIRFLIGYQK